MNELHAELAASIEQAWQVYDDTEAELWKRYAADRSYLVGREYVHGEQLARRRCDRTVQRLRRQRTPRGPK